MTFETADPAAMVRKIAEFNAQVDESVNFAPDELEETLQANLAAIQNPMSVPVHLRAAF